MPLFVSHKNKTYWAAAGKLNRDWFIKILFEAKHSNNFIANLGGSTLALSSFPKFRILWDIGDYDEHERLINET